MWNSCVEALNTQETGIDVLETIRKYQFMQVNTERRAVGLKEKIPDIQKTLETVRFLKSREVCRKALVQRRI
jgi:hypothetical protein